VNYVNMIATAHELFADDKGLLAMDESIPTCNKRFAKIGIQQTADMRRLYRDLLITAPGLKDSISGAILCDETFNQLANDGTSFPELLTQFGIIPGIKVDRGLIDMPGRAGEKITEGLDQLRHRLKEYFAQGARFAKWRAAITIGPNCPSRGCIEANASALARYAALCQEAGLVPIVEPEVVMEGEHSIDRCQEVTTEVLHTVFQQLAVQGVIFEALILKPNMVLSGLACKKQASVEEVATATISTLMRTVPPAVAAVAFLSGGQSPHLASTRLNAMVLKHVLYKTVLPWELSFSFARAIQQPALEIWRGGQENVLEAQNALCHRARCNQAARKGEYIPEMESAWAR